MSEPMPSASPSRRACRLCGSDELVTLYDFGEQPVAGYLETTLEAAKRAPRFRNAVAMCRHCAMVQQANDEAITQLVERVYANYQPTYSMSTTVRAYMASFLDMAEARAGRETNGYVLEIGSNDGSVLAELQRRGHRPIGLDPSADPEAAARHGYEVVRDYFGERSASQLRDRFGPAALVLSRHTLEHVFEPADFMRGLARLLAPGGLAVVEVPYLRLQLMNNQFQSMTFQHVTFFTAQTMRAMTSSAGLELIDVAFSDMDGGSIVAFIAPATRHRTPEQTIEEIIRFERRCGLDRVDGISDYFSAFDAQRAILARFLGERTRLITAFGAGSKGQALLNMLDLEASRIPFVIDDTPGAAGKFVPGMGTEVVRLDDARIEETALLFVTAPTHIPEVVRRAQTRFPSTLPILATAPAVHFVAPAVR